MFRFMYKGWIESCYTNPTFHFTYQFFDWVKPFDVTMMYVLVTLCGLSALCIGLGLFYRITTVIFFFLFTYLELIEKSWYLNHYYFVSLVAFLLILVPANRNYSLDVKLFPKIKTAKIPVWMTLIFKLQLSVVYFFGGIAKLKPDWLFEAQPLKIWLKARTDLPFLGWLFEYDTTAYLFSWGGMFYDLTIPFLLFMRKTRPIAYILVVFFHVVTYALFNIGMFPWLMMFGSLIFVSADEWKTLLSFFNLKLQEENTLKTIKTNRFMHLFLCLFFVFQLLYPLRYHLFTDTVLWTENGFRFAWHVMLMEKNGYTEYTVIDQDQNKRWIEYPKKYLSNVQEKQMSFQPDMIWQYAQFLKEKYHKKGFENVEIYVNSRVSLNGRPSQMYINPKTDLTKVKSIDAIYNELLPLK